MLCACYSLYHMCVRRPPAGRCHTLHPKGIDKIVQGGRENWYRAGLSVEEAAAVGCPAGARHFVIVAIVAVPEKVAAPIVCIDVEANEITLSGRDTLLGQPAEHRAGHLHAAWRDALSSETAKTLQAWHANFRTDVCTQLTIRELFPCLDFSHCYQRHSIMQR